MRRHKPDKSKLSLLLTKILSPIQNDQSNTAESTRIPPSVTIHTLVDTTTLLLNLYDEYTANHSYRVAAIAEKISRRFGRTEREHQQLHIAAHLHDIGKIAVPTNILNKAGRLTDEEFEEVKKHSYAGYTVIRRVAPLTSIAESVLYHHERYDGKGYPAKIKGKKIPFDSRIIAVADSFDAMTTTRPYQKSLSLNEAVMEISRCSGTQFDPTVVQKFEEIIHELDPYLHFSQEISEKSQPAL